MRLEGCLKHIKDDVLLRGHIGHYFLHETEMISKLSSLSKIEDIQ